MTSLTRSRSTFLAYTLVGALGLPIVLLSWTGALTFAADDYWQLCGLLGDSYPGGPVPDDYFRFFSGVDEDNRAAMRVGVVPWYADTSVKITFWRPFTSALHRLDFELFGIDGTGPKIHSLLWYVALITVMSWLYRRLATDQVAGVALVLFAIAAAHWQIVAWIAARNASITAVFGVGAVLAHARYRLDGWKPGWALSLLLFALALSAGEAALGALGYLAAFELFIARDGVRRRLLGLVPLSSMTFAWLAVYASRGYGTRASGAYLDPLGEPLAFLAQLPSRLFSMIGMAYMGYPADLWFLMPETRTLAAVYGLVSAVALLVMLAILWRDFGERMQRVVLLFGFGSLVAMIPQAAGFLGARSLTLPSVGACGVLACILVHAFGLARSGSLAVTPRRFCQAVLTLLVLVHVVAAPVGWFVSDFFYLRMAGMTRRVNEELDLRSDIDRTVVVLQAPDAVVERYLPFERRVQGHPTPRVWRTLSIAPYAHRLRRTAPDRFELEVVEGRMMSTPFETLFRRPDQPLHPQAVVDLGDMTARVLEVDDVGPVRVEFSFDRPLEAPSLLFLAWREGRFERFEMPPEGRTVLLPWSPGPISMW